MKLEKVVFALNGRRYEVAGGEVDPSTTLLEFIRTGTPFTGTKLGCGEGTYLRYLCMQAAYSSVHKSRSSCQLHSGKQQIQVPPCWKNKLLYYTRLRKYFNLPNSCYGFNLNSN
jgi:hypothetical protein